jgi:hypothetical protein
MNLIIILIVLLLLFGGGGYYMGPGIGYYGGGWHKHHPAHSYSLLSVWQSLKSLARADETFDVPCVYVACCAPIWRIHD